MANIKLLVFDIDGTLVPSKASTMSPSTIKALQKAHENGCLEIIATGRCSYFIPPIIKETLKNANYFITINGALITDQNMSTIIKHPISIEQFNHAYEMACKYDVALGFKFEHAVVVYRNYQDYIKVYTNGIEYPDRLIDNTKLHDYHLTHEMPMDIFIIGDNDKLQALAKEFGQLTWVYAYDRAMEAYQPTVSKAEGIKYLLERLNLTREQVMAFGDGENDIEMLEYAGIGIAMGNAHDEVKKHADFITKNCEDNGIEYALKHFKIIE